MKLMAIVIKEVIVKTTVERRETQWSPSPKEIVEVVKREVFAALDGVSEPRPVRKGRKDR